MLKIAVIVTKGWEDRKSRACSSGADELLFWDPEDQHLNESLSDSECQGRREVFLLLSFVARLQVNPNAGAVVAGIALLLQCSLSFGLSSTRCNPGMTHLLHCLVLSKLQYDSQFTCHMVGSSQSSNCTSNSCPRRSKRRSTWLTKYVIKQCDPTH